MQQYTTCSGLRHDASRRIGLQRPFSRQPSYRGSPLHAVQQNRCSVSCPARPRGHILPRCKSASSFVALRLGTVPAARLALACAPPLFRTGCSADAQCGEDRSGYRAFIRRPGRHRAPRPVGRACARSPSKNRRAAAITNNMTIRASAQHPSAAAHAPSPPRGRSHRQRANLIINIFPRRSLHDADTAPPPSVHHRLTWHDYRLSEYSFRRGRRLLRPATHRTTCPPT